MDGKKVHTKSRRGCKACKARKIKCDEKHPVCGPCSRKFPDRTRCEFGITFVSVSGEAPKLRISSLGAGASPSNVPSPSTAPVAKVDLDVGRPFSTRSLEIRLWHHYMNVTSKTMPPAHREEARVVWTEDVVQWAFGCEFLLDAVLGIAATHLYLLEPGNQALLCSADFYNARAAAKYRIALSDINQFTAGPIVSTAFFIGFQAKIVPRLHSENKPYRLPISFFHLQRGIELTMTEAAPYLRGTRIDRMLLGSMPSVGDVPDISDMTGLSEEAIHDTAAVLRQMHAEGLPEGARSACLHALAYVLAIHRGLAKGEPLRFLARRITAFPVLIPLAFVELLEHGSLVAMLILARWYAIMKVYDAYWWVKGLPEFEVAGIATLIPQHLQWLMDHPRATLQSAALSPAASKGGPSAA